MSGFLATRRAPRLTRGRLIAALGGCLVVAAAVTLLAPLLGVEMTRSGRHFTWIDLSAIGDPDATDHQVFVLARLPRALAAMMVGAALAAAGCAFQALLRNPLAEPFTLGISSGSSLAAVLAIRLGLDGVLGGTGVGVAALFGAAASVTVVWRLGRVGRSLPPATLLLAGVTVAMLCAAASMLVQYTAEFAEVSRMVRWMMGGFEVVRYGTLLRAGVAIGIGLLILLSLARDLNALAAGAEAAASVGVSVGRAQSLVFIAASLLVGASIAIGGPIGFVGLMVPHALRALVGPDHRVLLPASMLAGGALLVLCDTFARLAIAPAQLPVGIVTALLGAPFFLMILVRGKRGAQLWGGG
ncbi:MAG: iron ABC transporter permease [Kofleriaceae bacterium]|nr:iron ABC transporter permease [Kofleriaceae bacterium]